MQTMGEFKDAFRAIGSGGVGDVRVTTPPAAAEKLRQNLDTLLKRLCSTSGDVIRVRCTLIGDRPANANEDKPGPIPAGLLYELNDVVNECHLALGAIEHDVDALLRELDERK